MSTHAIKGNGIQSKLLWAAVIALGVVSFAIVALSRGEPVNASWLVIASVCIYVVAYRFYALFIADKVLGVNAGRQTPAYRHNDGLDYVPTNRYVLFAGNMMRVGGVLTVFLMAFFIWRLFRAEKTRAERSRQAHAPNFSSFKAFPISISITC